jgi:hypothetical protein
MEIDVRQKWADDTSLRRAEMCILEQLPFHHSRSQEFPDQRKKFFILDPFPQKLQELSVVNGIEVG